jgi:hypothetical protein
MNKYYILNNSNDTTLYLKDNNTDTRLISESKRFTDRRLASNYLKNNNLQEHYDVKLFISKNHKVNESVDMSSIIEDIKSSIDDSKDIIDTTLELIDTYRNTDLKEDIEKCSNIEEIADKLMKIKRYMSGITFTPSFDNSLGSVVVPETGSNTGGDSIE